jgi:hypothetical protein
VRKPVIIVAFLVHGNFVPAQTPAWASDSILQVNPAFTVNRFQNTLRFHEPIMYLTVPYVTPLSDRKIELKDGEGKNGSIAEGHFGYRFTIYKGKYYNRPVFQRMRLTFDVSLLLRLANDHSLPLLPTNNKFGLGFDFLLTNPNQLSKETGVPVWLTLQAHHYSNGQSASFFIDSTVQRNNYIDGDFSTNYLRAVLNVARVHGEKNMVSASVGYQSEVDPGGPLERSKELRRYYGNQRFLASFQWAQSKLITSHHANRSTSLSEKVAVERRRQFCLRTEFEYILGDVSRFTSRNKYRLGWHTYLTFMPSVTNEVGFIVHTYVGRDYLNIRFDDVVFIGAAGVCVKFNSL